VSAIISAIVVARFAVEWWGLDAVGAHPARVVGIEAGGEARALDRAAGGFVFGEGEVELEEELEWFLAGGEIVGGSDRGVEAGLSVFEGVAAWDVGSLVEGAEGVVVVAHEGATGLAEGLAG
jgi:hypothetical protein